MIIPFRYILGYGVGQVVGGLILWNSIFFAAVKLYYQIPWWGKFGKDILTHGKEKNKIEKIMLASEKYEIELKLALLRATPLVKWRFKRLIGNEKYLELIA